MQLFCVVFLPLLNEDWPKTTLPWANFFAVMWFAILPVAIVLAISMAFPGFYVDILLKCVCQMTGKPFILLPQTYGPFRTQVAQRLARTILKKTKMIYSRDKEGIEVVEKLIGVSSKIMLYPDVAFIMEPTKPITDLVSSLEQLKSEGRQLIGLNISGLLFHGGYTGNNMFGLACDYPALVREIICHFVRQADHHVLLVPHVLPSSHFAMEDDFLAARPVFEGFTIGNPTEDYSHGEGV